MIIGWQSPSDGE